ncbi:response regulator transcription factor [soil metagenome]
MEPEPIASSPQRRVLDRRQVSLPVREERRAVRLAPIAAASGVAIVVDSWPLMRAGISRMLLDASLQVAAEEASATDALAAVPGRLDLAVLGVTREPLLDSVVRIRKRRGGDPASAPRVVVMLERVEPDELRRLLAAGVEGVMQRTVSLDELGRACQRVLSGERVLSGVALSVLASSGLKAAPTATEPEDADTSLTPKEREVLSHLAQQRSNAEIARAMHVSAATVKTHLSKIYAKLDVAGRSEAVVAGAQRGLLG